MVLDDTLVMIQEFQHGDCAKLMIWVTTSYLICKDLVH